MAYLPSYISSFIPSSQPAFLTLKLNFNDIKNYLPLKLVYGFNKLHSLKLLLLVRHICHWVGPVLLPSPSHRVKSRPSRQIRAMKIYHSHSLNYSYFFYHIIYHHLLFIKSK